MQKRLRDVSVPVKAVADAAVEDRLAALEQQVIQEHAYKLDLVQAVQNLQAVAAAGQLKLEVHDEQAEQNRAEHLELRRELFAMRDQLSEKLNFVVQQTESQLRVGFVDIIEAKFSELETAMKTMASHMEQQHVEKPQELGSITNAFAYVDNKISQVTDIVKKFEKADAIVQGTGADGVAFTAKMRDDMFHMHAKLVNVDAEVNKNIGESSVRSTSRSTSCRCRHKLNRNSWASWRAA